MKTRCQNCLRVVSVPSRFKIFEYLKNAQEVVTISKLVRLTKLRQPTVTFHVQQLASSGLVKTIRHGREVYCSVQKRCEECPLFV